MLAWVFPGQGSQHVGMGAGCASDPARETFATATAILGWDVRAVCVNGPEATLSSTETAQPALLTCSVAVARTLEANGVLPDLVAGHSVGEFAALVIARALSFEDALAVVKARADAMARAGADRPGGMAAILGLDREQLARACGDDVAIANVNGAAQVVISGEAAAVETACDAARAAGARRVVRLAVSVAAHSPLMEQAVEPVRRALAGATLREPAIPFVSCTTGRMMSDPDAIARALAAAITGTVDWPACIGALHDAGARTFLEVGPGRVLTGLNRRILDDADVASVEDDASVARFCAERAIGARA